MGKRLEAHWAEYTKASGGGEEYGVVSAYLGGLSAQAAYVSYAQRISALLPGTPGQSASGPLPWCFFGPYESGGSAGVSASAVDWKDSVDAVGRNIVRLRYFGFRFSELTEGAPTGYTALGAAVRKAEPPGDQGSPARLTVPPTDWKAVSRNVADRFGWLAAGAAALPAGQVVVIGAAELSFDNRLGLLDSITALLPYGVRASLTASTFAESRALHEHRLYIADSAPAGSLALPWNGETPKAAQNSGFGDYLRLLHTWRDSLAERGETEERLVELLRELDTPVDIADSAAVLRLAQDGFRKESRQLIPVASPPEPPSAPPPVKTEVSARSDLLRKLVEDRDPRDRAVLPRLLREDGDFAGDLLRTGREHDRTERALRWLYPVLPSLSLDPHFTERQRARLRSELGRIAGGTPQVRATAAASLVLLGGTPPPFLASAEVLDAFLKLAEPPRTPEAASLLLSRWLADQAGDDPGVLLRLALRHRGLDREVAARLFFRPADARLAALTEDQCAWLDERIVALVELVVAGRLARVDELVRAPTRDLAPLARAMGQALGSGCELEEVVLLLRPWPWSRDAQALRQLFLTVDRLGPKTLRWSRLLTESVQEGLLGREAAKGMEALLLAEPNGWTARFLQRLRGGAAGKRNKRQEKTE